MADKRRISYQRFGRTDSLVEFVNKLEKASGRKRGSIISNGVTYRLDLFLKGKIKTMEIDNLRIVIEHHREFIDDIDYLILVMNSRTHELWFKVAKEYIRDIENIVQTFKDCLCLIGYRDLVLPEDGRLKHYVEVR